MPTFDAISVEVAAVNGKDAPDTGLFCSYQQ